VHDGSKNLPHATDKALRVRKGRKQEKTRRRARSGQKFKQGECLMKGRIEEDLLDKAEVPQRKGARARCWVDRRDERRRQTTKGETSKKKNGNSGSLTQKKGGTA